MKMLLPVILLTVLGLSACAGGSALPTSTQSPESGRGGASPPVYQRPVALTDGDYWPEDVPFDAAASRGLAAADAEKQKAPFEGTVAGIRLYSFAHSFADPSVDRQWCVVGSFVEASELTIGYLPGGTYANGPEYAGVCSDGSVSFVEREFTTKHGTFDVILYYGEPAFGHDASADRVSRQSIEGVESVVISPLTDEGFGRGWAARATPKGVLIVDGRNLPVSELTRVLGGVTCSDC